jgi:hypothetical protein
VATGATLGETFELDKVEDADDIDALLNDARAALSGTPLPAILLACASGT